jgi:hypothetical protein
MTFMTAALLTLPALLNAQVKDIDGWGPTKWGMSVKQASEALGGNAEKMPRGSRGQELLRIPNIEIEHFELEVEFEFSVDPSELRSVSMIYQKGARSVAFERLRDALIEKYGTASNQDEKRELIGRSLAVEKTALWSMPSTSIHLKWSEIGNDGDNGYVAIVYSKVIKSGL